MLRHLYLRTQEFQAWCKSRGIAHLTGAPYHPATNGAAERLVQSFKQALRKSDLPPNEALQEFLMQYRRTPLSSGFSPSELLNGRQIRTKIDTLVPSVPHLFQQQQMKRLQNEEKSEVISKLEHCYNVGAPCYAQYFGAKRDKDPRWVPAVVTKVHGTRSVNVRVVPKGPIWRRHIDQLKPRYGSEHDDDPCELPSTVSADPSSSVMTPTPCIQGSGKQRSPPKQRKNPRLLIGDKYGPHDPKRSARNKTRTAAN